MIISKEMQEDMMRSVDLYRTMLENLFIANEQIEMEGILFKDDYMSDSETMIRMRRDIETLEGYCQDETLLEREWRHLLQCFHGYLEQLQHHRIDSHIQMKTQLKRDIVILQCKVGVTPTYDSAVSMLAEQSYMNWTNPRYQKRKQKKIVLG